MRPLFIDTDTASDDAVALMMAFSKRRDDIVGIGVVAGNCPLEAAVQNALYVAELCGAEPPVFAGAAKPLMRPLDTAQHVHGVDGMGDIGLPLSGRAPSHGHAVTALIEAADAHAGSLELVTLGPLTNVAIALSLRPDLANKLSRCVMMGGASDAYGNMTPVSEYNIWADPEAAEMVFASDLPITMVGWDISRKYAVVDDRLEAEILSLGTERACVAVECQRTLREFCRNETGIPGFDLPDPIAMAIALRDDVALQTFPASVSVTLGHGVTRGQTVIDDRGMTERRRTVTVVRQASREAFRDCLLSSLA